jgi:23S rRNA pseudouridine1911/1915/1917 synthase
MASIGHPVVGDALYGAAGQLTEQNVSRKQIAQKLRLGRNFLHAAQLVFTHPKTRKPLELDAPLPPDLEAFLARLEEASGT